MRSGREVTGSQAGQNQSFAEGQSGLTGHEEVSLPLFPYRFDSGILPQLRIHDGSGVSQLTQV